MRCEIRYEGDDVIYLCARFIEFSSQNKWGNLLIVSDRDAYFEIPDCIQDFQRLRHLHKLARIIQIHECLSKLSSLQFP